MFWPTPVCNNLFDMESSMSFFFTGINVRTDSSSYLMHHKFVLIDGTILINGSFNWTRQAISGNQENLLITNNEKLVNCYLKEFEKLWLQFEPNK